MNPVLRILAVLGAFLAVLFVGGLFGAVGPEWFILYIAALAVAVFVARLTRPRAASAANTNIT